MYPTTIGLEFRSTACQARLSSFRRCLIIVGEGGAGKTTLARKILDSNSSMPKPEETTKGIDILEWHFSMENEQDFRVNIWDFGGQEIYHTTHQFFLTKRSLYLLVVDSRKEHPHLDYWLNLIELFTENSPLLIIKNAIGDRAVEVDENQLRGRFANLKESFPANLGKLEEDKRRSEFAKILNSIKYHIQDLPHIGTKLPKTWAKIRETLENDDHNYISLDQYFTICDENGFKLNQESTTDGRLVLSQYLHDLGVILHFQTDKTSPLYKTVILKPQWGTDAVYKVLDNETVKQNKGRFTDNDLSSIWQDTKYNSMQGELLALMLEFKLCYRLPNAQNIYIAPQLLDFNKPEYSWNDQENLLLNYEYDFMPRGISTRFIVEMHRYIDEPKVWRSGVVLKRENTFAEVIETYDRREIKIRLSGNNKRGFLEVITDQLDEIHASFKQLKVKKLIPCNCSTCKGNLEPHFYDLAELRDRISHKKENIECKKPPYNEVNVLSLIDDIGKRDKLIASPKEYEKLATPTIINNFLSPIQEFNLQQSQQGDNTMSEKSPDPQPIKVKSAWANGSFYLVIFIVVVAGIGFLGSNLPFPVLCVVIIAGVLFVPIIGALQLKQDDRVKDETFLELMKLVIGQLPLIGNPLNKLLNPADKSKDQE
jgi:GTPase SAR1 family protein